MLLVAVQTSVEKENGDEESDHEANVVVGIAEIAHGGVVNATFGEETWNDVEATWNELEETWNDVEVTWNEPEESGNGAEVNETVGEETLNDVEGTWTEHEEIWNVGVENAG